MDSQKDNKIDNLDITDYLDITDNTFEINMSTMADCIDFGSDTITFDSSVVLSDNFGYDAYTNNMETDHSSGTITLTGPNSDINIDGMSLRETLKGLNDRLAILQVNPALEAEFDELHALGEQYRALERKLLEKKAVWNALNGD